MRNEDAEPAVPLARDGLPLIGGSLVGAALLALLARGASAGWWSTIFASASLVAVALAAFFVNFFRDPKRSPPDVAGAVISPADGKIIAIRPRVDEPRFLGEPATLICIFMSPVDVHVNRAPIDGEVVQVSYNPGKYFAAYSDKASLDNEQNAVVVRGQGGRRVLFIQIAGFVARRIVCRVAAGDQVRQGQRIGMIKLGSRVDVYVPGEIRVDVKLGDAVRAGETVLGVLS